MTAATPCHTISRVKGWPLVGNLPQFLRNPLANAQSLEVHGSGVKTASASAATRSSTT